MLIAVIAKLSLAQSQLKPSWWAELVFTPIPAAASRPADYPADQPSGIVFSSFNWAIIPESKLFVYSSRSQNSLWVWPKPQK